MGESLSKKCNGNHSPCAGRETKDTELYTSLIVNVILRRFAARAKCSRHHGVNLASPCIFRGFVEKKELRGGRSSTSTSPATLRTGCSFDSASHRGEQGECWLHIALGLAVERWWSCTPPGSGKSGRTVEGWWSCTSPGSGKCGVIGSFLWWCFCIFLCLRLCWIAELYIFKMGDDFINSEEYLFVPPAKARRGAFFCAFPRLDEECARGSVCVLLHEDYASAKGIRVLGILVQ